MKKTEIPDIPASGKMPRPKNIDEGREVLKNERFVGVQGQIITFHTNEFTSICPRSGQPDFGQIEIIYMVQKFCLESKSLKFYLWSYRDFQGFCERISQRIAEDIIRAVHPFWVKVKVHHNVRGGIDLIAKTELYQNANNDYSWLNFNKSSIEILGGKE